jgi:hypothetical protein
MTTTQLFAELLVIGIGAACWLSLLLAAAFGYRFDAGIPKLDASSLVALGAVAYVLGIVVDRMAYALLKPVEKAQSGEIIERAHHPDAQEMERYILVSSDALGKQIQYNRSRLRICRAWVLNALLVLLAFVIWDVRVGSLPFVLSLALVGIGLAVCVVMAWTVRALLRDHYKNLLGSYDFLKKNAPKKEGR